VTADEVKRVARALRAGYDALSPGAKATLRRCTTADELRAEGVFWRLVEDAGVPEDARFRFNMAFLVHCFDLRWKAGNALFARWLRSTAYGDVKPSELPARSLRFRRLLAADDRDELVHHLRALLQHGFQKSKTGIDWGELGADIAYWGGRGIDTVRRRWAEQFFTNAESQIEENRHV
jgi:CRISPR type I-E-associated protein CasB/Cse2